MADQRDRERDIEQQRKDGEAKRTGRDGVDPEAQPGEFADDVRINRFEPPPPPRDKERSH